MDATKSARREYGTFEEACKRAASFANRHHGGLELAERFLDRAGWLHATFGVTRVLCADRELLYLNTGDTYDLTIGEEDRVVFTTTWGDWYETTEREYCDIHGVIRCGYCGEFTPVDKEDWSKTVCESCSRYVSSGEFPPNEDESCEPN